MTVMPYNLEILGGKLFEIANPENNTNIHFSNSYDMKVVTKECSIAEKISRLTWDSNPVCPDKNPIL